MLRPAALLAVLLAAASAASAQAVDPAARPALGPDPTFRPPAVERFTLSNGLPVLFVAKPGVPVAQVDLLVRSGATSDPDGRGGLATLTADLMDEGAGTRTALELADAVDFLGVTLESGSGLESLAVRLHAPVSRLDAALPLMADVALRPAFAEAELDRLRLSRLTDLAQVRDEPRQLASLVYDRTLYGDASPYGRPTDGTPASTRAVTRADVVRFHDAVVRPSNAALVVVGALDRAAITPLLERLFGAAAWPDRPAPPRAVVPAPTQVAQRSVVLVDTAGLRKKARIQENIEFYALLRTQRAIQSCDVAVLLIDAERGLETQDAKVLREAESMKKGLVIAVNKWDTVEKETNTARDWERTMRDKLGMMDYVPVVFVSALTGQRAPNVLDLALQVYAEREKRVPTPELNEAVEKAVGAQHPPTYRGTYVKIKYSNQVREAPPVFAFFCNHPEGIGESYRRYMENQLRKAFGFVGVPLTLSFKKK